MYIQGTPFVHMLFQHFFKCAQRLEDQIVQKTGRQVFWLLLSDAKAIRHSAKAQYGNKVGMEASVQLLANHTWFVKANVYKLQYKA